jgi:two-component system cell cycle response regulator CtrA
MKRKLLLDDEPDILQTLSMIMKADGYSVETAWSSKEALCLATQEPFDLVVTDFNMPEMKGDELALLIKDHRAETPVMMLSGSAEILRTTGREMPGVDLLMGKPFSIATFRSEITRLMAEAEISANPVSEPAWSDSPRGEPAMREG